MKSLSDLLKLNWRDLLKGLLTAVLSAVFAFLAPVIDTAMQTGVVTIAAANWTTIWHVAVAAGAGYLFKQLITNSNGQILVKEPPTN